VDADLDTLATALYVRVDDLLKSYPERVPWRPKVGIEPKITDAELVTLSVMAALLGFTSEARWLRFARAQLRSLFPYLPQQPGYNKRLRNLAATMGWLVTMLARDTTLWTDDAWLADSTPVECGRSRETAKRSDLAGFAEYGYCASHSRYFWGLRLHLLCTVGGLPVGFALTGAKADERHTLLHMIGDDPRLAGHTHQTLIADKNYFGAECPGRCWRHSVRGTRVGRRRVWYRWRGRDGGGMRPGRRIRMRARRRGRVGRCVRVGAGRG